MVLYFITGNKFKFGQVKKILGKIEVKQLDIDLDEVQSLDPKQVIRHKLREAKKHHKGRFLVEDTSLTLNCMNNLPGPLIKWFLESIGNEGLFNIASKFSDYSATAKTIFGYFDGEEIFFFESEMKGKIVEPKVDDCFGWNPIFKPERLEKSLAEMTPDEQGKINMRGKALQKFVEYYKGELK